MELYTREVKLHDWASVVYAKPGGEFSTLDVVRFVHTLQLHAQQKKPENLAPTSLRFSPVRLHIPKCSNTDVQLSCLRLHLLYTDPMMIP